MRPFTYQRASDPADAVRSAAIEAGMAPTLTPPTLAPGQFLAGGTTLLDLMKLDTMRPSMLIDIGDLGPTTKGITADANGLHLGASVHMQEVVDDRTVQRDYPVIAQSLALAASAQLRNMATLGGNVLQRTRCNYFRDPDWAQCNKREPGSGCAALTGVNRKHAVLGVSDRCIATYPGDFAQALIALDAQVEILGANGPRVIQFADLHRVPGDTPHIETNLAAGELITGFRVAAAPWTRRSVYVKVRDRQSYEYGLATAAVALDLQDGQVREARIALGGVATKPWRAHAAEAALQGKPVDESSVQKAAEAAFADAKTHAGNAFKPELGRRTLSRALFQAATMKV
jgi:xanthine dehydrogenase YagS FAD-binding subunit